ncbi:MAG TPA: DNA polymerase I [Candidatus Polarisedimenticolia bacterium]|nr:DNA polymerase I [Candidatus Polarisedimenticolia bacterium]
MPARSDPARTLYLIDGSNNLYRAFHAIRELRNSRGLPTNAVYGFTAMMRKLIKDFAPRHLAVVFDRPEPTFRHVKYPEYKAHRPETPEELIVQIPWVKKMLETLRIPTVEAAGWEADDLIGTLAGKAKSAGMEVIIVATDKDLLQLVEEGVQYWNPVRERLYDAAAVEAMFGVRPDQVADVLALWGDESDNIPGVRGIGDKGAKDLIRKFGNLEALLAGAGTIENRRYREPLLQHAADARMSLDLATIRRDAPVDFDAAALTLGEPDVEEARRLYTDLEFGGFLRELPAPRVRQEVATRTLLDPEELERLVTHLAKAERVALSLETDDPLPMRATLIGIALASDADGAAYVPLRHHGLAAPRQMSEKEALQALQPLFRRGGPRLVGHDVKGEAVLLARLGVENAGFGFDELLADYLLNSARRLHTLEAIAEERSGLTVPAWTGLLGEGARAAALADVGVEQAAEVACARVAAMLAVEAPLRTALEAEGLAPLYDEVELPVAAVLAVMERSGIAVDAKFLAALSGEWDGELQRLKGQIYALAGVEFNINSPKQLAEILFDTLKLTPGRKTRKTGSRSTDVEVLEELAEEHELPRRILEYRGLHKLKSTYVDALPVLVDPHTHRVHTSFNQAVAATGRLSSTDPNLQNIPIRTEQGRQIRRAFVPAAGMAMLSADYSQIELRVLAHLSGDRELIAAFQSGQDIHTSTAATLFGVLPGLVTGEMRRRAKAVNFGIVYGMGPQRLARDQGVTVKEAEAFIREYFARFPQVKAWIDATIAEVESTGRVRTLFGRVREFPEMRGADRNARQQAIRAAVNTPIQGTAADLIKKAMVDLQPRLEREQPEARLLLQVHDELVLEAPKGGAAATGALVREVMESARPLAVPLVVDLRVGPNWLDLADASGRSKD